MNPYTRFGMLVSLALLVGCGRAAAPVVTQSSPGPQPQATLIAASVGPSMAAQATATPALPVASTPATATPVPAAATSAAATSAPVPATATPVPAPQQTQPASLQYMWPGTLPQGLRIDAAASTAAHDMFALSLSQPGSQWFATVTGGFTSRASLPPTAGTQPVTVRGVPAVAFTTGAGYSVFWTEGQVPYAVMGSLSLDETLALANDLAPLDIQGWAASLESIAQSAPSAPPAAPTPQQTQAATMLYFWPTDLPAPMHALPQQSTAGSDAFVTSIGESDSRVNIVVTGGRQSRASQVPTAGTQPVTVRGLPAVAFTTGAGYSVFWTENGIPYAALTDMSLDNAVGLVNTLEAVDLTTWQSKREQAR